MKNKKKKTEPVRGLALNLLVKTFRDKGFSNYLYESAVEKNRDLNERDRAFLKALYFGVLRNALLLDSCLAKKYDKPLGKLPIKILMVLRLGLYQLIFMDRVPPHAAVSESVSLARKVGHVGTARLVNALLRRLAEEKDSLLPGKISEESSIKDISQNFSHPEWFVKKLIGDRGFSAAVEILKANNEIPPKNFRVLDWKQLEESGVEYVKNTFSEHGAELAEPSSEAVRTLVKDGSIAPQDQSSLVAVSLLAGAQGKILELCCGRGNKSIVLRNSIDAEAKLICADLSPNKVLTLSRGAEFHALACDVSAPLPFKEKFDSIFIDLPCTNLGAIRHHPEIRYNRQPEDVEKAALLQRKILSNVSGYVKPGGRLLYAVCSTEPEEGRDAIARFLAENNLFEAIDIGSERSDLADAGLLENGNLSILPGRHGMDGMFAALLGRKG